MVKLFVSNLNDIATNQRLIHTLRQGNLTIRIVFIQNFFRLGLLFFARSLGINQVRTNHMMHLIPVFIIILENILHLGHVTNPAHDLHVPDQHIFCRFQCKYLIDNFILFCCRYDRARQNFLQLRCHKEKFFRFLDILSADRQPV